MRPILRRFLFCWAGLLGDSAARHGRTVLEGSVGMIGKVSGGHQTDCFPLLELMVALKIASLFRVLGRWEIADVVVSSSCAVRGVVGFGGVPERECLDSCTSLNHRQPFITSSNGARKCSGRTAGLAHLVGP
jgi:hypothetical protein